MKPALIQHKVSLFLLIALAVSPFTLASGRSMPSLASIKPALQKRASYANELFALATDQPSSPVPAQAGSADLIVKEIVFEQSPAKIRVRVLNQGAGPAAGCHLALQSLTPNDSSIGTKQRVWTIPIPALAAGKGFSNAIDVSPLTQANGPWRATIDRSNAVAESNEDNNSLTFPSTKPVSSGPSSPPLRRADLVIEQFELTDPAHGVVRVVIANKGSGNSKACQLRLIVWEPGKFEQKEARTIFVKVPALHVGQTITVNARPGVPMINTKYSLYIDIGEEVLETDENNNRAEGEAGNFKP